MVKTTRCVVAGSVKVSEYVDNVRALWRQDPVRWRVVIERQVLVQVLPRLQGTRALLEPDLWQLLVLCLDGPDTEAPPLDDGAFGRAEQAVAKGRALLEDRPAAFPRAATAVHGVLVTLRQAGLYPPPKV
jgi:hypothetical protein